MRDEKVIVQLGIKCYAGHILGHIFDLPVLTVLQLVIKLLFKQKYKIRQIQRKLIYLERVVNNCNYSNEKAQEEISEMVNMLPEEHRQAFQFLITYKKMVQGKITKIGYAKNVNKVIRLYV